MTLTLDAFALRCRSLLMAEPTPAGRQKVCALLVEMLHDPEFVRTVVPETTTGRELRYEDPDLKFCIFAEHKRRAKVGLAHDHGPSWAIYGQAAGETTMTEWERVEPAMGDRPGKVRRIRSYLMTPGVAHVYDEGVLHSTARTAPGRLIRFEGMNLETLRAQRPKYDIVD
jgi:hypothetical protein